MAIAWNYAGFSLLLVFLLDAGDFCDGGVTSSFVRTKNVSADMPLDSDVFQVPLVIMPLNRCVFSAMNLYQNYVFLSFDFWT